MYNIVALPVPSNLDSFSSACAINSAGDAAGLVEALGEAAGVIWLGGSFDFSLPSPTSYSALADVNSSGDAVGVRGWDNPPTQNAIVVRGHTVNDLTPVVGNGSGATGINDAGLVCGWS